MKINFRELQKALLQHIILPLFYKIFCYQTVDNNLVVFADSRDESINYNSRSMYEEVVKRGYKVELYLYDFSKLSILQKLWKSILFMKLYARAKYVFIYNYYLPVSSCEKRSETKVIQLWHASGLQKKYGYDSPEDLGELHWVSPTKNYDLVSVSGEDVVPVVIRNWKLNATIVKPFGTSRTDLFFSADFKKCAQEEFYKLYPEAQNKKIVLWAPSFRGKDTESHLEGIEDVVSIKDKLPEDCYFIIKLHPHLKQSKDYNNCKLATEKILCVADVLITDYSSVFYDYLLLSEKTIFFVPDYAEYRETRGMYIDYHEEFPYPIIKTADGLVDCIKKAVVSNESKIRANKFIEMNDGAASKRIMDYLEQKKQ